MRASMISAALVAALVGYGSTIALVLAAAAALGATPAQTASWVLAICLSKAVGSAVLSAQSRVPVVLAWSTPGAALIAATSGIGMAEGVGAFVLAGLLVAATGLIGPLGRIVAKIPDGIAAGMLAGVLLPFCLKLAPAAVARPGLVLAMVAIFAVVRLKNPAFAVLAALAAGLAVAFASGAATLPALSLPLPRLTFIAPEWSPGVLIGLGVPLYLVTMASQNLPGFATLRAAGFEPPVRPALAVTGGLSALTGLFGAHTVSMAAITAAICLGPDVEPDRTRRWRVGLAYAAVWVGLGLSGPVILALLAALPADLMAALVALALLGPLTGALTGAFAAADQRFPAVVTLTVTASGMAAFGIGAAFWGLVAGLAVWALERAAARWRQGRAG
ncbi:benzoate/H(+) symporter BenE family transporter [Aliigemmobacter aestuarii]|uniref:Benzoate/H(+) symporter BenE family transporter n=1 Tax=Aliigemmobacter aestuarii TaxID=1445661 RepID=A0A4S3MIU4_9RHOB|nr:benzoate/H(+) symporter BenE family transporter [Gemmobacter aestuarii]THD81180.1 benzoate/H(+) symporter BenE family transporter [Gemmobacter aestuarii]